jgi:cation transport regulator ChaB
MADATTFAGVLESVEQLSLEEQEELIDLVRHRLAEQRRDEIAANISLAVEEYRSGQTQRGTVDDLLAELDD